MNPGSLTYPHPMYQNGKELFYKEEQLVVVEDAILLPVYCAATNDERKPRESTAALLRPNQDYTSV